MFGKIGFAVLCGVLAAGCGGGSDKDSDGSKGAAATKQVKLKAPAAVAKRGELRFCSDMSYPPEEFIEDGKPAGSDIEIAQALAKRMGVKATFRDTGFDDILTDLVAGKCDAVISGMTDNAERRKLVHFIDYLRVGQSLMVPTANPHDIMDISDLAGRTVAVQAETTNEQYLRDQAKNGDRWGDEGAPKIVTFAKDTDAAKALKNRKADAYFGDSPVVAYYIGEEALTYAFAGKPVNAEPLGIAVAPDQAELEAQLDAGIDAMYGDGTLRTILAKWKLDGFALEGS